MKIHHWRSEHTGVVLATLLAALMRFSSLDHLPPQAWNDEVWVSARAYELIQTGEVTAHYGAQARGGGGDAGLVFLTVIPELLGLHSLIASRAVTAAAGTLAVPVAYCCFKELFADETFKRKRLVALLAAGALSYLPYQTILSRVGMEAGSMPVMYLFCVWQIQRGLRRGAWSGWVLAGLVGGSMQYAGLHTRFVLPLMAFMIIQAFVVAIPARRWKIARGAGLFSAIGVGLCLWLIITYIEHPAYLWTRGRIVMNDLLYGDLPPALAIASNGLRMLGSINFVGDNAGRHNVPGAPMLDPVLSIGFFAGAIWSVVNLRRSPLARLLLAWLALLMIPSMLTVGAPNFERTSAIVGAPISLAAVGWGWIADQARRLAAWPTIRWPSLALAGLMAAASVVWCIYTVFVRWPQTPTLREDFMVDTADVLHRLVKRAASEPVFVDVIIGRIDPPLLALGFRDSAARRVSLQDCLPLADGAPTSATYVVNSDRNATSAKMLTDIYPDSHMALDQFRLWEEGSITEIVVPPGARIPEPTHQPLAEFMPGISLFGYNWSGPSARAGGRLSVSVYWKVTRPIESDLTAFFHIQHSGSGEVPPLAQSDQRACASTFPTTDWQPGMIMMDWFEIPLPADLAPGKYEMVTGWYDSTTYARMAILASDQSYENYGAVIGAFVIPPH